MGFLVLAKHGLNKTWIRAKFGLILEDQTVERERGEEKREEEGEKKRERRRGRRRKRRKRRSNSGMFSTWDQVYFDFLRLWFGELFLLCLGFCGNIT